MALWKMILALWILSLPLCGAGGGEGVGEAAKKGLVLLLDVYDTTFLVGSASRCSPSCTPTAARACGDLNNDDVTRFGLGERKDFTIVRDACPPPHLVGSTGETHGEVAAVISTDFELRSEITWRGQEVLEGSPWVRRGEALNTSRALQVAWIIEPRHMSPKVYEQLVSDHGRFDLVFTHVRELQGIHDKFRYCPFGTTYLRRQDHRLYAKSRLVSIVASRKGFGLDGGGMQGHRLRHEIVRRFEARIGGVFADGYATSQEGWHDNKLQGLKDYMFTIVVENVRDDCWFTEKLIDAFLTGTVPIYWGCPTISKHFEARGMLVFSHGDELEAILGRLSAGMYASLEPFRDENFRRAKKFVDPIGFMWLNGIQQEAGRVREGAAQGVRTRGAALDALKGAGVDAHTSRSGERRTEAQLTPEPAAEETFLLITVADQSVAARWFARTFDSVVKQTYGNWRMRVVLFSDASAELRETVVSMAEGHKRVEVMQVDGVHTKLFGIDRALEGASPEEIAVLLHFGDWLVDAEVLGMLAKLYASHGCWMSYGSAVEFPSGRLQSHVTATSWDETEDGMHRGQQAWRYGNLYTFRVRLFRRLHTVDLTLGAAEGLEGMARAHEEGAFRATAEHARLSLQATGGGSVLSEPLKFEDNFMRNPYDEIGLVLPLVEMSGHRVCFVPQVVYVYNVATRGESYRHQGILGHAVSGALTRLLPYERLPDSRAEGPASCSGKACADPSASGRAETLPTVRIVRPEDAQEFVVAEACEVGSDGRDGAECMIGIDIEARGAWLPEEASIHLRINDFFIIASQRAEATISLPAALLPSGTYTVSAQLVSNGRQRDFRFGTGMESMDVAPPPRSWQDGDMLAEDIVSFFLSREGESGDVLDWFNPMKSAGFNITHARRAPVKSV